MDYRHIVVDNVGEIKIVSFRDPKKPRNYKAEEEAKREIISLNDPGVKIVFNQWLVSTIPKISRI